MIDDALASVPTIDCETYADLRRGGSDIVLLDVREQNEWEEGHLPESVHIPRGFLELRMEETIPDKHQNIIVCCDSGGRAALAAKTLLEMGYTEVKNLEGGYSGFCELDEHFV